MNVIAIDGPSSSGKSTIARQVAKKLGISYVNSGLFYRTVTYLVVTKDESKIDDFAFISVILENNEIIYKDEQIFINGENKTKEVSSESLTSYLPTVTSNSKVRDYVNIMIRKLVNTNDIVIDGRDIGTVIFPNADVKIYLDADVNIRAKRRFEEQSDTNFSYDEILERLQYRDRLDMSREVAPLKKAEDAIVIDSTNLTIDEIVNEIANLYNGVK